MLLSLSSCSNTSQTMDLSNVDKIIYKFKDSSVPPPYHRSYEIVATATTINVVVDSYGDIIAEKEVEITKADFDVVVQTIESAKIEVYKEEDTQGCTGGTTDYLDLYSGDVASFSGYRYNCGGQRYGTMQGNIVSVKKVLQSFIPDFLSLLE